MVEASVQAIDGETTLRRVVVAETDAVRVASELVAQLRGDTRRQVHCSAATRQTHVSRGVDALAGEERVGVRAAVELKRGVQGVVESGARQLGGANRKCTRLGRRHTVNVE